MSNDDPIEGLRQKLEKAAKKGRPQLIKAVVNAPFSDKVTAAQMFLGIVVLLIVNKKTKTIDRIALSNTSLAKATVQISVKRFEDIKIPIDHYENIIAEAIHSGKPQETSDWNYLFTPALTGEEARFNQAGGGIGFSAVYPLVGNAPQGAIIFSFFQYADKITKRHRSYMKNYTALVSGLLTSI